MLEDPRKLVTGVLLEATIKVGKIYGDRYGRWHLENEDNWSYLDNEAVGEANQKLLERGDKLMITYPPEQNWLGISNLLYGDPIDN